MVSFEELLARTIVRIQPVIPSFITSVIATVAVLLLLAALTVKLDVEDRRYYLMSIFVELRIRDAFYLAFAWFKLITLITYLFSFKSLTAFHYVVFLIPGVLYCIQPGNLKKLPVCVGWLAVEFAGLLSSNLVISYYLEMSGQNTVLIIYIILAVAMTAFGIYRFFYELEEVSDLRMVGRENGRKEKRRKEKRRKENKEETAEG